MVTLSPPPDPPTGSLSDFTFKSPSLAVEVAEALQHDSTLSLSTSVTPTDQEDQERRKLLDSVSSSDELVGVSVAESSSSSRGGYVLVSTQEGN